MAETMIDWREFDNWRAPGFEVRLFPEWFDAKRRELLKFAEMPEGAQKKQALADFHSQTPGQLNAVLWNPDLRIFGRPDSPNSEIEELVFSHNHKIVSWPFDFPPNHYDSKIVIQAGAELREYYDVYVFPFLVAPLLAERLSGLFDKVLSDRLWADPQLLRIQPGLSDLVGALDDGHAMVPIADRPVAMVGGMRAILDGFKLEPGITQRAADIASDRLSRLFALLLDGSLALHGRDNLGRLRNVPVMSLREASVSLCLSNAAICQGGAIAWTDLRIGKLQDDDLASESERLVVERVTQPIATDAASGGREPDLEERLPVIDSVLAELLSHYEPLFKRKKDFSQAVAQGIQSAGLRIGNRYRGGKAVDPKVIMSQPIIQSQVDAAEDWLRKSLPKTTAALVGQLHSHRVVSKDE